MKILRFNDDRIGVIKDGNMVVDVSDTVSARRAKGPQRVMEEIIEGWRKYRKRFEKVLAEQSGVPLDSVQLRSPFARPGKFLAAFSNYIDRPERTADNFPNEYFYKSPDLVGPGEAVELRDIPACVVYQPEAEFAFVIGKTAKDVTEKKALDHVFGYVPMFDISTRGLTRRTQFIGKGQGSHGCCGPWIITKDEIPDPHNVVVKSWTNGEPRGEIKPTTLSFAFDEIDSDEGTARIIGAFGPSEIIVRLSTGNLHFVQAFREGPLYTTTVFPRETRNGNLQAVHSRHEYTEVSLPGFTSRPEQYYGECAIGP